LWRILRADATGSGIAVLGVLVAVPALAVLGAPRPVLVAVGLVVVAAAVVLAALGTAMAAILGPVRGDVELPPDLEGLRWPGAGPTPAGPASGRRDTVWRAVAPVRVPRGPRP